MSGQDDGRFRVIARLDSLGSAIAGVAALVVPGVVEERWFAWHPGSLKGERESAIVAYGVALALTAFVLGALGLTEGGRWRARADLLAWVGIVSATGSLPCTFLRSLACGLAGAG